MAVLLTLVPGVDGAVGESRDIGERCILHISERADRARGFASSWLFALFLVGDDVEGDEEEEVGGEDSHAREGCEFLARAFACIGHPLEVG